MSKFEKGAPFRLNVTQKASWRIFAGLGWDPNEAAGLVDKAKALIGGKSVEHDLDLSCYIYDADKRHINTVTSSPGHMHIDQTGKIYHSGDNVAGVGDGDDEQISVELKDLDPVIHSLLFAVSIKSGHVFGEIKMPEIHLSDGYTGRRFLHAPLDKPEYASQSSFVFACLYRGEDEGWMLRFIGEAGVMGKDAEMAQRFKSYLD
ncbi:MAG: TerD family protein [Alphaproteobacteria bacterium]|nr:TerD family protein [Alphaproteobacteria bacterium]